jgi:hypothetical protein
MRIKAILSGLMLAGALVSGGVHAALVSSTSGLIDYATGLEWLRVTATQGQTYNSVMAGYGGYVTNDGWRFANTNDISTLFGDAGGVETGYNSYSYLNAPAAELLISLLGMTENCGNDGGFCFITRGLTSASNYPGSHQSAFVSYGESSDGRFIAYMAPIMYSYWDYYTPGATLGSFLIRDASPVPEPGSVALLGLALASLAASRRKSR